MKRALAGTVLVLVACAGLFALANVVSLDDGIRYLQAAATYSASLPSQPFDPRGKFGFCEQFMALRSAQRAQFIANFLDARGIAYERLPISETGFDNVFVPFAAHGPYTIYSAHYDKFFDDPEYQGASDNSAAVCALLVAAEELNQAPLKRPLAILFTGQEEVGLVGAKAFYDYATKNDVRVAEVLNFDSLGRGGLAARASGEISGFVFSVPLLGEFVYDGRELRNASAYRQPDANLIARLQRIQPLTVFDRMVAKSDGTYFQDNGWNAVNLTSDDLYYLEQTWHTYGDRIELLAQDNLERALDLMLQYAQQEP
jgi:hypothetical protein